jgi:hypothetical protein
MVQRRIQTRTLKHCLQIHPTPPNGAVSDTQPLDAAQFPPQHTPTQDTQDPLTSPRATAEGQLHDRAMHSDAKSNTGSTPNPRMVEPITKEGRQPNASPAKSQTQRSTRMGNRDDGTTPHHTEAYSPPAPSPAPPACNHLPMCS